MALVNNFCFDNPIELIPSGFVVIFQDQEDASFCGYRENVTQLWKNDGDCKLLRVDGSVACNCTKPGEVTTFQVVEEESSPNTSKSGVNNEVY